MNIGLCMVVKDEAKHIVGCLEPIIDLFGQVVIADTGSTDGTPELLRHRFGIDAVRMPLDEGRCGALSDARNALFERLSTPWVFLLDADERVDRTALARLRSLPEDPAVAGFFAAWINHVDGNSLFQDYKLFLFRRGTLHRGLVHDNAQADLRRRRLSARWLDDLAVHHFPDTALRKTKTERYRQRLTCALEREPANSRYHWFLGYMDFLENRHKPAMASLGKAAASCSPHFPVECLNSRMVLAEIHARRGAESALEQTLTDALRFYRHVAEDFEVRVNGRLLPWLEQALGHCREGRWNAIRAYRFAC